MNPTAAPLRAGIDVGSTTVKLAVLDQSDALVWQTYERHRADIERLVRRQDKRLAEIGAG